MPFILLLAYILIEIALFIWIGSQIGVGWTLLWVLGGFVVGVMMLRRGGAQSREWLQKAQAGEDNAPVTKQLYWYIGGLLVILPGFFTDFLGALLVFPPTQSFVTWLFSNFIPPGVQTGFSYVSTMRTNSKYDDPTIIDVEAEEVPDAQINRDRDV